MLNNDWFDDFLVGPQCDEVADLGWLDAWKLERERAFPRVSSRTIEYRFHRDDIGGMHAKLIACDILGNSPKCPIACDNVVAMPKSAKMPSWYRPQLQVETIATNADLGGLNPMVELRYNLFGKMLANFHENGTEFLQAEQFDKCFKGE
jgi:hypothetical protein